MQHRREFIRTTAIRSANELAPTLYIAGKHLT
jgi:hypothetical protein